MPSKTINYENTYFYKIVCNDLTITDCYVGHTTDFRSRKSSHKSRCINENNKSYNLKVYKFIRDNGGWINWSMVLIEQISCDNSLDAHKRERELYEVMKATLNKQIPNQTSQEYNEEHKNHYKQYYELHKDYYKEYYKEKISCSVCSCITSKHNLLKHQQTIKCKSAITI